MSHTPNYPDLVPLLMNRVGMPLYSPYFGTCQFVGYLNEGILISPSITTSNVYLSKYGTYTVGDNLCKCIIYPSQELYELYPDDAKAAWEHWKKSLEPKWWRATEPHEVYWFIDEDFLVSCWKDNHTEIDNIRYSVGNYFDTKEKAQGCLQNVLKTIEVYHNLKK